MIIEFILLISTSSIILIMAFNIISGTIDLYMYKNLKDEAFLLISKQKKYTVFTIVGLLLISISINISNEYFIIVSAIYMLIISLYFASIIRGIGKNVQPTV